jgi:hypothetical protein
MPPMESVVVPPASKKGSENFGIMPWYAPQLAEQGAAVTNMRTPWNVHESAVGPHTHPPSSFCFMQLPGVAGPAPGKLPSVITKHFIDPCPGSVHEPDAVVTVALFTTAHTQSPCPGAAVTKELSASAIATILFFFSMH